MKEKLIELMKEVKFSPFPSGGLDVSVAEQLPDLAFDAIADHLIGHGVTFGRIGALAIAYPQIADEWHPSKNGDLTPEEISAHNNKKVWWKCSKGHEWQAIIENRTKDGNGCPYCSGRRAIPGENDLATVYPQFAKEWHPTKNGGLMPQTVKSRSSKKVWWICGEGHEWPAIIRNRVQSNSGCPVCKLKKEGEDLK